MSGLFGTDGVRGRANDLLTAELALELSVSAAHVLSERGDFRGRRPVAVVGRDPRVSGHFLHAAVLAGLTSAGVDVLDTGVLPTPGVAHLTAVSSADLGVVLSASHNPMPDNGIKLLSRGGVKLADEIEEAIEARLGETWQRPTGAGVGRVHPYATALEDYVDHLVSTTTKPLAGLRVVLDCANGAASWAGPRALEAAGATVTALHAEPDGLNINDRCGSTHLPPLQQAVVEHGADAGFALDGDADRCLAVDASGEVVDGDQILCLLGRGLAEQGRLARDTVVATVMSNVGFERAMTEIGVRVHRTQVGDRYVLEAMQAQGYVLGGEQSGHVVIAEHASTGDGILTALQVLERMAVTGTTLAGLAGAMTRFPQVLVNVPDVDKSLVATHDGLQAAVTAADDELGAEGRVLLRPSGTEPLVRVMVEAPTAERARAVADHLAGAVRQHLALP